MVDIMIKMSGLGKAFDNELAILTESCLFLWEKGWSERNAGNISADITRLVPGRLKKAPGKPRPVHRLAMAYPELGNKLMLITGTGQRFRDFSRHPHASACIIRIAGDGKSWQAVWGGNNEPGFMPTSELPSHLGIHSALARRGRAERVVLHTHPTELIALTHLPAYRKEAAFNQALQSIHPEVKISLPHGVGLVPYKVPASLELGRATASAFERGVRVAAWEMHGCVAVGRDGMEAFDHIDTVNKAAKIILLCLSAGVKPRGLSPAQIQAFKKPFKLPC